MFRLGFHVCHAMVYGSEHWNIFRYYKWQDRVSPHRRLCSCAPLSPVKLFIPGQTRSVTGLVKQCDSVTRSVTVMSRSSVTPPGPGSLPWPKTVPCPTCPHYTTTPHTILAPPSSLNRHNLPAVRPLPATASPQDNFIHTSRSHRLLVTLERNVVKGTV